MTGSYGLAVLVALLTLQAGVDAGPSVVFEPYSLAVEMKVAAKRREAIATLEKLVGTAAAPAEAPSLLLRLAELYWEESKYQFFEATRKDDDILQANQFF